MKNIIKTVKKQAILLSIGLMLATLLILGVNALPTQRMQNNLKKSAVVFEREGTYWETMPGIIASRLDNFTDAKMLLISAYNGEQNLVERAMSGYSIRYDGKSPAEILVAYVNGEEGYNVSGYTRYWHGYQVILKPLLMFFDYQEIRWINMLLQVVLVLNVVSIMVKKELKKYIMPYAIMLASIMPQSIFISLQFSTVFYITNIAILVLIKRYEKITNILISYFLILGMLTSFFDFLTYPIVAFFIPMIFCLILEKNDKFIIEVKQTVVYGINWLIGYLGMWLGKWIIGSLLLGKNIIKEALDQIILRTSMSTSTVTFTHLDVIKKNVTAMFHLPFKWIWITVVSALIVWNIMLCIKHKKAEFGNWMILVISVVPFIWYVVAGNHSYVHFWFTYRNLSIFVFSILAWLVLNIEKLTNNSDFV